MNKIEFNGHKLEMFDSIQELPIFRFQLYNLNLMLDAGIGSDINDFDSRCNNVRRLMIKDQEAGVTGVRVKADIPLSEMFGYIGSLRTMTSGRGQFSMEFSHYSPCPQNVSEKVIAETKERNAAKK